MVRCVGSCSYSYRYICGIRRSISTAHRSAYTWVDRHGNEHRHTADLHKLTNSIDIISWNILGPIQGESSKHTSYATLDSTAWTRRRERIVRELLTLKPAVLCLQEVTSLALNETLLGELAQHGYQCAAFAPNSDAINSVKRHSALGCAIFTRNDKIKVLASKRLFLRNFVPLHNCKSAAYSQSVMSKKHSMAVCVVQIVGTNNWFILGNSHLYWNPKRQDIKALQTQAIVNSLSAFINSMFPRDKPLRSHPLGVVVCGDFNCMPYMHHHDSGLPAYPPIRTAPFEIMQQGYLGVDHPEHPDSWYKRLDEVSFKPDIGPLNTPHSKLKFSNIYELAEFREHEPLFTTKTNDFQGWIDHLWVNSDIQVERVLSPGVRARSADVREQNERFPFIPTKVYPSDHLPIGCVLSMKQNRSDT
mmetsp:Transcript_3847/g.5990  ORF Transcript_3847/g.5990 Transcript_3847/m.5990 type:complete len:417 (+) Transcript_3847:58-1308(+)